jgi:hypothetical protein
MAIVRSTVALGVSWPRTILRTLGSWPLAVAIALSASVIARSTLAEPRPPAPEAPLGGVALAEVASRVDPRATRMGDVVPLLRQEAAAAIAAIDWGTLRLSRRYAVAATAVRLSTTRTSERTLATSCVISASVREADTGTLLFTVEGRALAEDQVASADRAERDALRAAVTGAMRALPEGLRRAQ